LTETKVKQFNRGKILTALRERIIDREIPPGAKLIEQDIKKHCEVIKAIMEGDPIRAENTKRSNLRSAREYLKKYEKWVL
jgi:DNA-binding GntR family transcriptional regulator